jgi:hypothetical protein
VNDTSDRKEIVRRKTRRIVRFLVLAPFILAIFLGVFGFAVLYLWNWLMPELFGLPTITFWQGWGLMALSWILLGGLRGFGGSGRHSRHGRRQRCERWQRWQEMTPEERAALRETLDRRGGGRLDSPATGGAAEG